MPGQNILPPAQAAPVLNEDGTYTVPYRQMMSTMARTMNTFTQYGTTAQRPTSGLYIGYPFFDTTVGKPIWVRSVGPVVWVDGAGTVV